MPVLCPRSSADFSAVCLPPTVTAHASSSRSSSLFVLSSSTLRKRHRRCTRKAEAPHQDGNPFVYLTSRGLAICHGEFVSRQSASGTNAVFNTPRMQEKEESVSIGRLSLEDTICLWNIHTQRTRAFETCAMKYSRRSNSSRFAHSSESFSRDDFVEQNQFQGQSRSSRSSQDYDGSLGNRRPKAPLLTENQPSRLHNEATVFEGIREPLKARFDGYQHTDQPGLVDDAASAFSNVTEQGSKLISEEPEHKKRWRKGTMFLSKLEEELANLQKNINFQGRTGESSSFMHAAQGSQGLISEAKGTEANGAQMDSTEKDLQKTFVANKTSKENASEFTSFNLFSSSPSVPWEVDTGYPSNIPISKNRRPISRRTSTSIGSRSSPSSRSVTARNNYSSKVGLQVMNAYDSAIKVIEEDRHRKLKSVNFDKRKLEDDRFSTQSLSENKATVFRNPREKLRNFESDAASGISYALDSGKQPMETASAARENIDMESSWKLEKDTFSEVIPLQSSSIPMPEQDLHKYDEFDREDEVMDALESFLDDKEFSAVLVKDDLTVFSEHEANMANQHSFSEIDGAKVSTSVPDAEHDILGLSNSEDVDIENAHGSTQLNSKGEKHLLQNAGTWHKHNLPDLPFDFQYSYTETPQRPILGYRETQFSPFGPLMTKRPWTGGPPNNPSKKKQYALDSFNPPPNNTKGVKPVEAPGPYPEGHGPKAAKSREEILGEPLTREEIIYLVEKCRRETRQLNLGRDGLTHNMLDLIHSYWKRRRVCRIKCKGVPTVDMDNVKFHIEDKTGGKIIYHTGGVFYLFRGRNYNHKDRPNIPMMLWKPPAPLYPKLIQPAPEGLTIEDATRLRYLGRKVEPICTLGKNGVYLTLVEDVRDAFKVDDLVRVDCQKLKPSDYKKIGAKLQDLVPCVLLSFDKGNILMWKGKQENQATVPHAPDTETMAQNICCGTEILKKSLDNGYKKVSITPDVQDSSGVGEASTSRPTQSVLSPEKESIICEEVSSLSVELLSEREHEKDLALLEAFQSENALVGSASSKGHLDEEKTLKLEYVFAIDTLWEHALQSSMAVELQEEMDSDRIVRKADEVAQSAPLAPDYSIKLMYKLQLQRDPDYKPTDEVVVNFGRGPTRKPKKEMKRKPKLPTVGVPGMGGLPVDELAKLLVQR